MFSCCSSYICGSISALQNQNARIAMFPLKQGCFNTQHTPIATISFTKNNTTQNYSNNTKHVCTHFNVFLTVLPNMVMKFNHFAIFKTFCEIFDSSSANKTHIIKPSSLEHFALDLYFQGKHKESGSHQNLLVCFGSPSLHTHMRLCVYMA